MATAGRRQSSSKRPSADTAEFYRAVLTALAEGGPPFLVGGGFAFRHYTGIERYTKDMDLFVRPRHASETLSALAAAGFRTELLFPHWLAKVYGDRAFVDVIFNSGNGVAVVDDEWFRYAEEGEALGIPVRYCPVEETIWSKAYVAERERYDGADVAHLLHARGELLDWPRLMRRFGDRWRVLLSHLVLYGFIYPGDRDRVPSWVMSALMRRLSGELGGQPPLEDRGVCRGTLLSREQYLPDLEAGYLDGRLDDDVGMSAADIVAWTRAIQGSDAPQYNRAAEIEIEAGGNR
jgi:hypothetical protein